MKPFDSSTYLKQVLGKAQGGEQLPDMFERYLLDYSDDDEGAIEARRAEVKTHWDRWKDHPKYGSTVRRLSEEHNTTVKLTLLDAEARAAYAKERQETARQEDAAGRRRVEEWELAVDRWIEREGSLRPAGRALLAEAAKHAGISPEHAQARLDSAPPVEAPEMTDEDRRRQIERALTALQQDQAEPRLGLSLFHALGIEITDDQQLIEARHRALSEANRKRAHGHSKDTWIDVLSFVQTDLIRSDPRAYIEGLVVDILGRLSPLVVSAVAEDGAIDEAEAKYIEARAVEAGLTPDLAARVALEARAAFASSTRRTNNIGGAPVYGIDLGTTYSCIARVNEFERAEVIDNEEGDATTPSVVMFADADSVRVGKTAKQLGQVDPYNVCELVKREMGDPDWRFSAHGRDWTAPEVSAQILRALAAGAESQARDKVERVVMAVPTYFGVNEREATKAAGKIAGLEVVDLINEPTAAAFSYGFGEGGEIDETVLVFDLGGTAFDVSVVKTEATEQGIHIRVVATGGDYRLGGAQWDAALVELMARKFMEAHPDAEDPLDDPIALGELKLAAENVKRTLSNRDAVTQVVVSGTTRDNVEVTREEFDAATEALLTRTIDFTRDTIEEARELGAPKIDRVLLAGGSTFMPQVAAKLRAEFGFQPELQDPHFAVARGAALWARERGRSQRRDYASGRRSAFGVGIAVRNARGSATTNFVDHAIEMVLPIGTSLPVVLEKTYVTDGDQARSTVVELWEQCLLDDEPAWRRKGAFSLARAVPSEAQVSLRIELSPTEDLKLVGRAPGGVEFTMDWPKASS